MIRTEECETLIVGGGSAGCVLAARLSAGGGGAVMLVEAGPDYGLLAEERWPKDLLDPTAIAGSHDWGYRNEPRPHGDAFPLAIGRVLGGSSAVNAARIAWPLEGDLAEWAAAAGGRWEAADLRRCFARVESDPEAAGAWHGRAGPVSVTRAAGVPLTPYSEAVVAAAAAEGLPWLEDVNDPSAAVGIGRPVWNMRGGVRWNAALAYLGTPAARARVRIRANARASRVLVAGDRATGAEGVDEAGGRWRVRAERTVVSAGAYNSPALLLRSGIGAASELPAGVAPVHELAGVGRDLADHAVVPLRFGATEAGAMPAVGADGRPLLRQIAIRARRAGSPRGCQIHLTFFHPAPAAEGFEYVVRVELFKPRSRGCVSLARLQADDRPRIDSRFLSEAEDQAAIAEGVSLARRLMASPQVARFVAAERVPGAGVTGEPLARYALANAQSYHHPLGTCRIGPASDPDAVVDGMGRVHGLDGLHVADASILPSTPAAPINLSCLAVGERIAELLTQSTRGE